MNDPHVYVVAIFVHAYVVGFRKQYSFLKTQMFLKNYNRELFYIR